MRRRSQEERARGQEVAESGSMDVIRNVNPESRSNSAGFGSKEDLVQER